MDGVNPLPIEADLEALRQQKYNATITYVREAAPGLNIFRISPDSENIDFSPGQFTTLGLLNGERFIVDAFVAEDPAKLLKRAYSMSHPVFNWDTGSLIADHEMDYLEFYIVLVKDRNTDTGKLPALTPRLFGLEEGTRVFLGKITGNYTLKPNELAQKKHLIFCATGTGEAPHNAMIWKLLKEGYLGRMTSIICARNYPDLAYAEIYQILTRKYPNLTYIRLLTREPQVSKKYIQDIMENGEFEDEIEEKLSPSTHAFYLCGNPAMIGIPKIDRNTGEVTYPPGKMGMIEWLEKRGFRSDRGLKDIGNIHYEKYW